MSTKTTLSLFFSFFIISNVLAQEAEIIVDIPSIKKPWSSKEINNDDEQFQFAVVTDRTGGHRPGVFMKGVRKLNLMQPEFVMSVGDLIEGYTEDTVRLNEEWKEFNGFIDSLQVPFFYVPGNHDITNETMEKVWVDKFGVTYYHFVYKDILFLCLNSEDNKRGAGRGTIDDEQFNYIKNALAENEDAKWTLVFLHQPLWVQNDTKRWKDVEELLKDRPHNVFAGHYHRYWKTERNNGKYIALATTGGGSRLRGTSYGEFDHVVWITMTQDGPIIANLLLNGVWDEDVVTDDLSDFVRENPVSLKVLPQKYSDPVFDAENGNIIVRNDSDYKISVSFDVEINTDLVLLPEKYTIEINPNSLEKVPYSLKNLSGKSIDQLKPIGLNFSSRIEYPSRPDLVLKNYYKYRPVIKYSTTEINKVKVDGNIREWDNLKYSFAGENKVGKPFDYQGENDSNLKFSHGYDDEYYYIAFKVLDDDQYVKENEIAIKQDMVILGIDARSESSSSFNNGRDLKNMILLMESFKKNEPRYNEDNLPEGTITSFKINKDGYQGEIAIPISYLNDMQKKDTWEYLRMNIGFYDFDQNGKEKTEIYWKPLWNRPENVFGTGMIYRK